MIEETFGSPPAVTCVNEAGISDFVLVCEHASNYIPAAYRNLGLESAELERHIAWDIGAAELARLLSRHLDAPLFLSGASRLLIDCNRPLGVLSSIPVRSETTDVPGNRNLNAGERAQRAAQWFWPFHDRIAEHLDRRTAGGRPTIVVGIHSFTPVFLGVARPWQAGVLYAGAVRFAKSLVQQLTEAGLCVGDNEPYRIEPDMDYTVPVHGDQRGINAVLVEVRQDLLLSPGDRASWAARLATALSAAK